jgi:carboxypeptidase family protein
VQPPQYLDVDLDVRPVPSLSAAAEPQVVRSRRSGRFLLEVRNGGNIALDVELGAVDADRSTRVSIDPERLRLEPGSTGRVVLTLRGPRMYFGGEVDRQVMVEVRGRTVRLLLDPVGKPEVLAARTVVVTLKQRALISRGLLTVLILMSIVALWAGAFLLGLGKVFASDPLTKSAPASFFAAAATGPGTGSGAAPAGALPKNGTVPAGTGGEIDGTVLAAGDAQPVGRILVRAWRRTANGLLAVSSAATQADGTYSLVGLFPISYYLEFSATGYRTVWFPDSPDPGGGRTVGAQAQGSTQGINVTITGLPASISGTVDPGDTLAPVTTTVTARALLGPLTGKAVAVTKTNAAGAYVLTNLPAPMTYQLTFVAPGYRSTSLVDAVSGGAQRLEPVTRLGAGTGTISGTVFDGTTPLGGATISTTVAGKPLTVLTPTVGQVGTFVLSNLPTPGTYVITFAAPGHGSTTQIVDLKAGANRAGMTIQLTAGSGAVTGRVVDATGRPVGGATVTVGGAVSTTGAAPPSTTTLTAGSVGSFALSGLAAPGAYTLTASAPGYAPGTVPVTLSLNGPAPTVTITLSVQSGAIGGTVFDTQNRPFPGATVTATDGQLTWTGSSNSSDGRYLISGLAPGSYTVTVTAAGRRQQTALVTVSAGVTAAQNLVVG